MDVRTGRFTVVNDAYNAHPTSMAAALRTVAAMPGRSYAILGEMAELGSITTEEHRRIGVLAADLAYQDVVTVGQDHGLAAEAGGRNFANASDAFDRIMEQVREGDVVLVKASRSVGLETVAERLIEVATS
jgi:UDP-N-acetylmuramoyl-tripeptide--D-alanyl-D-alanine ligase